MLIQPNSNSVPQDIQDLCHQLSLVTYENLSKILRYAQSSSAEASVRLDDAFHNDLDQWMGGGTCFSMTWHLYEELRQLGYKPHLLMGHKRRERNIHCALRLDLNSESLFFDPGYMIFDPLPIPQLLISEAVSKHRFDLVPNWVELQRKQQVLELWTGSVGQSAKLRFEFPLEGVEPADFFIHWKASFHFEMMTYPVLNRLDREKGIQYYFQKGNLVTRTPQGSTLQRIDPHERTQVLSQVFQLDPVLIDSAFATLKA